MKKNLLTVFSFFCLMSASQAQLVVDTTSTPTQIVEDVFLANGIFVSNVTYNGVAAAASNVAVGSFTSVNTGLGIDAGILMCTGSATQAVGPNDGFTSNSLSGGIQNDPDINNLLTSVNSYDGSVIEFDFIATGDSLDFVYVFGSEEFNEFVGTAFNDVFGFFISGPGISGPFSNSAVNIALIPGTSDPVSINNVNLQLNSSYYLNNESGVMDLEYDGLTVPLHASIGGLTVGETYHIKLAVADVADSALDSGVFLSGSSFVQICSDNVVRDGQCMVSSIRAHVDYTEECGTIYLTNDSEVNITTTGCHYEMGDGNDVSSCDGIVNYTYATPGTYTVKLVYQVNSFRSKFTIGEIEISDIAPIQPQLSFDGQNTLSVTNWDGSSSLQWYLNGAPIPGANANTYVASESGNYQVTAVSGCLSTSEVFAATISGINENTAGVVRVYPNPSEGIVNVSFATGPQYVRVLDASGRQVRNEFVNGVNTMSFDLSSGFYTLQLIDQQKQIQHISNFIVR